MPKESSKSIGMEICEALGLNPSITHSITINIGHDPIATVTVEMFIKEDGILKEILDKYELHLKGE